MQGSALCHSAHGNIFGHLKLPLQTIREAALTAPLRAQGMALRTSLAQGMNICLFFQTDTLISSQTPSQVLQGILQPSITIVLSQ